MTLKHLIHKTYQNSSLIPIFMIEVLLLLLYFGISYFMTETGKKTLLNSVKNNLVEISLRETEIINKKFVEISRHALNLQYIHQLYFSNPDAFFSPTTSPIFKKAENGVFYKVNNNGGSSLFYATNVEIGAKERKKALKTEMFDPLFKTIVDNNPNLVAAYINTFDDMNRYYPFIDKVYNQFPSDLHMADYNFYYLADQFHNFDRKPVWTGAYLDPAGQGWMISNIVPIYRNDFLEGVTGLDVTIENIIKNLLKSELPWEGSAFLVDNKGMILAMPEKIENIFELKELKQHVYQETINQEMLKPEEYNILKSENLAIKNQFKEIFDKNKSLSEVVIGEKKFLLSQDIVPISGWRLFIAVDKNKVFEPIYELQALSKKIGFGAIAAIIIFYILFFIFLLRRSITLANTISAPIFDLTKSTTHWKNFFEIKQVINSGIEEIDILSSNFEKSSKELSSLTNTFKKFVPKQFLNRIANEGIENIELGKGQTETMTILFSDIRAFTNLLLIFLRPCRLKIS